MAIDFNTAPYYDDFSESSNYYRILFKPGRAVQARELTQMQSMLQNQIKQFGSHIFKENTKVSGCETFLSVGTYVRVQETSDISNFEGEVVIGDVSGAKGTVVKTTPVQTINGTEYDAALHIAMISGEFEPSETITIEGTTTFVTALASNVTYSGQSYLFNIASGIFYTKNHFVYCPAQTVVVSPTFVFQPSARIGLQITEGINTSDDDETLLDPAIGSTNYFAPGADRYYIDLTLSTIEYDPDVENSDTTEIKDFIQVCTIRKGEIVSINSKTIYNQLDDALARRTYDESGDYTVRPFIAKVVENIYGNTSQFSVQLSPGKAYVKGFEFETIAPNYLSLDRALDTEFENGYSLALDYARYLPVNNVRGFFNFTESQSVAIHKVKGSSVDVTGDANYSSTRIGNAKVRYLEHESGGVGTGTANVYNLYLFDIVMNTGNTFSEANSFVVANITTTTKIANADVQTLGTANLTYSSVDDTFLFKIPQENIATFLTSGTSDTTYIARQLFSSVAFAPGTGIYSAGTGNSVATITVTGNDDFVGSGILGDTAIQERYYAVVTASGSGTPAVGTILDFTGDKGEVEISGKNSYLRYKLSNTSFTANVIAMVSSAEATSKVKTVANATITVTAAQSNNYSNISLGYSDVIRINSIVDPHTNTNSYTSVYVLDSGQRDDYYDHATIRLRDDIYGNTAILGAPNASTVANITISFDYFQHTGTGPYFDVDSYLNGGISWGEIPTYTTSKGDRFRLSDVIDARPVRVNNSNNFATVKVPAPNSTLTTDFYYYLPRRDKLVLTKDRKLTIVRGISSKSPYYPVDLPDAMTLYSFDIPAYTARPSDVNMNYVNNRRYTMRDIGKLEKRIDRLEYYTALSFLEKIAADQRIPSLIPGIDRFKNGILVDPFAGHSVSDVTNGDLKCSIDFENRLLRPRFVSESFLYSIRGVDTGNINELFNIVTINYSEVPAVSQLQATNVVFTTPFDVFNYTGVITLEPSTDVWYDTKTNPTVVVNLNGENDAFTQMTLDKTGLNAWGTKYSDWQGLRAVTDVKVDVSATTKVDNKVNVSKDGKISVTPTSSTDVTAKTTVTTTEYNARSGLNFYSAGKTITTQLGEKVVDSSIIPWIRSRSVDFKGRKFKPNTQLFATFDGVEITEYCTRAIRVQVSGNTIPVKDAKSFTISQSGNIVSKGNVILQRANVAYVTANILYYIPEVGNSITFANATTSGSANAVLVDAETTLVTDEAGDIAGTFVIPNTDDLKFNLGERAFRLTDSLDKRLFTTAGETIYLAYGLSQTKEDTTLATRINLVSIDPTLEIKTGSQTTSVNTSFNRGVETVGTSNEVTLPQAGGSAKTILCGQKVYAYGWPWTGWGYGYYGAWYPYLWGYGPYGYGWWPYGSAYGGYTGEENFKINLGTGTGASAITINNTYGATRMQITYDGQTIDSGMTSTAAGSYRTTENKFLKQYGYPEVTRYASSTTFVINKRRTGVEFAELKIESPLSYSRWFISTTCPAGAFNSAPGTARLNASAAAVALLLNHDNTARGNLAQTAETDMSISFTITNTAGNPRFTVEGDDKTIRIEEIQLDTSKLKNNEGTFSLELSGTTQGIYGSTKYPGKTTKEFTNTLGSLPVVLQPGQSRTFSLRISKSAAARINGTLAIKPIIYGPGSGGTKVVACNNINVAFTTRNPVPPGRVDPLAQTFFVEERDFPNGLFVSSVDLWFYSKDDIVPASLEIRPVVNGFPSSRDIVPFAYTVKNADEITASTTFDVGKYTRFNFLSPVYLPPNEYAFVITANSKKYRVYSAVIGGEAFNDPDRRSTEQPYIGSLFKSQNASTWTPIQEEDLTFRINRCKFTPNSTEALVLEPKGFRSNVEYDLFFTTGETVEFVDTALAYSLRTTSEATGTLESNFRRYLLGSNLPVEERKIIKNNEPGSLRLKIDMLTNDDTISPVLDLERLSSVLVRNIINNDATGEDQYSGGNALARYITRRVTLNPEFAAQDLRVQLNAYCPGNSSIKVYFKVNAPGTTDFDTQNKYVEMDPTVVSGDNRSGFAEYTFTTDNIGGTCLSDGATFTIFTIKIVMLSDDTTQVPIIRDLRAIATDEP